MQVLFQRHIARFMICVYAMGSTIPADAAPPLLAKLLSSVKRHGRAPETCQDPAVEELAANLDWLEHNIDRWGTIVAKSPDIWGEARLTKYRREVEEELKKQVSSFKQTLAGAESTRDTALLAASLQMARGANASLGEPANVDVINTPKIPPLPTRDNFGLVGENDIFAADKLQLEPTVELDQRRRYLEHLNELRRINEGDDASDAPGYSINLVRIPVSVLPGSHTTHGFGAELTATATMQLDNQLLPNTFRDLVINDLVDQLALPMTRFLNSDPAKVAQLLANFSVGENQDAYVDRFNEFARLYPVITDNPILIQVIKDSLARNGQSFSGGVFFFGSDSEMQGEAFRIKYPISTLDLLSLETDIKVYTAHVLPLLNALENLGSSSADSKVEDQIAKSNEVWERADTGSLLRRQNQSTLKAYGLEIDPNDNRVFRKDNVVRESDAPSRNGAFSLSDAQSARLRVDSIINNQPTRGIHQDFHSIANEGTAAGTKNVSARPRREVDIREANDRLTSVIGVLSADLRSLYSLTALPSSLTRRSTLPFPPSELLPIYGDKELGRLALAGHNAFRVDVINRQIIHLTDVQSYVREELNAAYDFACQPEFQNYWQHELSQPTIVPLIRGHRHAELAEYRCQFLAQLPPEAFKETVASLAWTVFVESVLLNEKMNREIVSSSLVPACVPDQTLDFFGPNPTSQAREVFASYVSMKWPLRIFTIDPVDNDQNIAETASIARQMQFAAAFAVASGEMSARSAMNFARNLQRDFSTVGLNRTTTGFVHGDNTFGWRFQPRFQTPPVQSNGVVIIRDLLGGGPTDNALRRQQRLEPGMRECVAMILTPSFVSGITIDTRSNWYLLNKPGHSALSMQEITEQSRSIVAMRRAAETCVRSPDLYRDGEVSRMLRRVDQLDRELPLQTLTCQLPNSNTLGGFELFSSGTRELAPELLGWYGSPGYQQGVDKQVFFLVGENFSVHETQVIVGTKQVTPMLLSRQIMQVTLPKDVPVIIDKQLNDASESEFSGYVDAHVATPYGVSGHMLIPVIKPISTKPDLKVTLKGLPTDAPMEIRMTVKKKDGQYSTIGNLILSHAPVASIEIPTTIDTAKAGLLRETVDVVLSPKTSLHTLAPAVLNGLKVSSGKLSLGIPELIDALGSKGTLYASLEPYGLWLVNNGTASENSTIDLTIDVSLSSDNGKSRVPIGELPVRFVFLGG